MSSYCAYQRYLIFKAIPISNTNFLLTFKLLVFFFKVFKLLKSLVKIYTNIFAIPMFLLFMQFNVFHTDHFQSYLIFEATPWSMGNHLALFSPNAFGQDSEIATMFINMDVGYASCLLLL